MLNAVQNRNLSRAFDLFCSAWQTGRPIVPLFGAGISASASIPFGAQISNYLLRIKYLSTLDGWRDSAEYLTIKGWPSRHQLNAELYARHARRGTARTAQTSDLDLETTTKSASLSQEMASVRAKTLAEALRDELARDHPTLSGLLAAGEQSFKQIGELTAALSTNPPWAPLLQYITGRNDSLIDSFFDRLVRNRTPSTAHQFIAFLTRLVGLRLILTTNFDDLIETALRAEGLSPVVYEIVKGGGLPDEHIVKRHLALIKMHGGAFGLRAGLELNDVIDEKSLSVFTSYVPRDAVLLVLGQSGERRILSLLDALASKSSRSHLPFVVWVFHSRSGEPSLSTRLESCVIKVPTLDAALFLQDLYQRLTLSHPVGRNGYQSVHHLPEIVSDVGPTVSTASTRSLAVASTHFF